MSSPKPRAAAQLSIAIIAASLMTSCATPETGGGLGLPPTARGAERPAPYDPFGTGDTKTAPAEAGVNTVPKSNTMAAIAPQRPAIAPQAPIDAGASVMSPFAGMSGEELKARWGAPSLIRNEVNAALWQFQGKGCVVLAYLYPSASGAMETGYAEARPGGSGAAAVNACLGKGSNAKEVSLAPSTARKPALMIKPE